MVEGFPADFRWFSSLGVRAFIQNIIARGTESSAVTAEWAMSELLRRSGAMAAATDELSRVVGRTRWATERDLLDPPLHRRRREQDGAAAPAPGGPAPRPAPGPRGAGARRPCAVAEAASVAYGALQYPTMLFLETILKLKFIMLDC